MPVVDMATTCKVQYWVLLLTLLLGKRRVKLMIFEVFYDDPSLVSIDDLAPDSCAFSRIL